MARNQGEGDRKFARKYAKNTQKHIDSGQVKEAARQAKPDEKAERAGRDRAKEFDPAVHRDYDEPERG